MGTVTRFFLTANSGDGRRTLSGPLVEGLFDVMLLRGGPGGEVFLRQVGQAMEDAGAAVEYFADPDDEDALEGLFLPEAGCAVLSGGPEPRYPGAVERIIDLGRFFDVTAAKAMREEIIRRTDRAEMAEARAFHALKAAQQLTVDSAAGLRRSTDRSRLDRRINGIIRRELARRGNQPGRTALRFLSSVTGRGTVAWFDTVDALCPRVYELEDSFGLAGPGLSRIRAAAVQRGWDCVACLPPEEPRRIEHLLIPGLGLAFVTSRPGMAWPGKHYRRLRLDALVQPEDRGRVRFENRLAGQLRSEAAASLACAAKERRELPAMCRPYVDLDGLQMLAVVESARLLGWMTKG